MNFLDLGAPKSSNNIIVEVRTNKRAPRHRLCLRQREARLYNGGML
ncbi:hypothetical protein A2U01_0087987, partial [Trifolium medium]|nr:hypothetical protein [Trifolium medium]